MIFPLLLISLCPIPTTLGAFIDKAVQNRVEGSNTVHYLCDTMSTAYPAPLEASKETSDKPQLPPTDSLQALTLDGTKLSKELLDNPSLTKPQRAFAGESQARSACEAYR
ncbi:hypothetical protein PGTUg99_026509 [Puccinia graminis f. sp. tritici]|uniref:Uncharacterized protein n=1 Tax=Puccinia graminis f. sp. tritici TaxID=56615 RepID=A0A5B0RFZ3_PUCGR|nr:hypothetical protein PGTUg99_026509 [Puccinia graminis f. sp. tritici]